jgi:hypothetical protein
MSQLSKEIDEFDFIGSLNFQSNKVTRSLITKGDLYAIIDPVTSGFQSMHGNDVISEQVPIINGRGKGKTLDVNGFELVHHECPNNIDFSKDDTIVLEYYPTVADFVKLKLGAYKVFPFGHFVRSGKATMKYEVKDGQRIGGPALVVHGDYSLEGGPKRRDNFAKPPAHDDSFKNVYQDRPLIPQEELDTLKNRRFAIVNLWRSIAPAGEPLVDMPLCFCDAPTAVANDYGTVEFRYVDRMIETYMGFHSPDQRFYYFPNMLRDEGVLLKTFDSQGVFARDQLMADGSSYPYFLRDQPAVAATSVLHSAVKDPRVGEDAPTRKSVEVRCMVFY